MTDDRPIAADEKSSAERLLAGFATDLAAEERALGAVEPDELAAVADGRLDAAALAVWQERVARRPELAARAEDLAAFRRQAYPEPARVRAFPAARRTAWRWAAGIAAALLVALLGWARTQERSSPPPAQSIFSDGFESGDASRWATDSPS
jgi:hypothetical protein